MGRFEQRLPWIVIPTVLGTIVYNALTFRGEHLLIYLIAMGCLGFVVALMAVAFWLGHRASKGRDNEK